MTDAAKSRYDVVIIGSGIASLTCASLLAKKGRSVCVLERYKKPGGYLHGFRRFGQHFDTGAHYIGAMREGQPFRQLLEYAGVYDESLFVDLDPVAFDVLHFPHLRIEFPRGYSALIARLQDLFPREAKGVAGFFGEMQLAISQFQTYRFSPKIDQSLLEYYVNTSLAQIVDKHTRDDDLRAVLFAHCVLHGVRPQDVAFGMHAIMMDSFITGSVGLARGGDALAEKFARTIESYGGRVSLRKQVAQIENDGANVRAAICTDGERVEGDWFVSGIHVKKTFSLLSDPSALRPVFKSRLEGLPESVGMFGVYAACASPSGKTPIDSKRNYFFFRERGTAGLFDVPAALAPPRTVFANIANRMGDGSEPEFGVKFLAMGPYEWFRKWEGTKVGHRGSDYDDFKQTYSQMIWREAERYLPGIKEVRLSEVTSSPLSNLYFNSAPEGSGHGIYHSLSVTGPRAIGPRTHLKNLLVTGQSTLFPGFLGAATAGVRAAGNLLGIKELLSEIQGVGE